MPRYVHRRVVLLGHAWLNTKVRGTERGTKLTTRFVARIQLAALGLVILLLALEPGLELGDLASRRLRRRLQLLAALA